MDGVADETVGLANRVATDVHVAAGADHAEEAEVVRIHPRPPDRRWSNQTPRRAAAVRLSPDRSVLTLLSPYTVAGS